MLQERAGGRGREAERRENIHYILNVKCDGAFICRCALSVH